VRAAVAHLGVDDILDSNADSVKRSTLLDGDRIELARRLEHKFRVEEGPRLDGRIALLDARNERLGAVRVVLGQRRWWRQVRDRLDSLILDRELSAGGEGDDFGSGKAVEISLHGVL
jgi:hypothetical protein